MCNFDSVRFTQFTAQLLLSPIVAVLLDTHSNEIIKFNYVISHTKILEFTVFPH